MAFPDDNLALPSQRNSLELHAHKLPRAGASLAHARQRETLRAPFVPAVESHWFLANLRLEAVATLPSGAFTASAQPAPLGFSNGSDTGLWGPRAIGSTPSGACGRCDCRLAHTHARGEGSV